MNQGDHINQSSQQEGRREPPQKTGIILTAGAFIGWYLSTSTNGVFNFFNDSPGFQLYPFCFALWAGVIFVTTQLIIRHKNIPWLFMIAGIICVTFFVLTVQDIERKEARVTEKAFMQKPHLKLALRTPGLKQPFLELTNAFLLFSERNVSPVNILGFLIAPPTHQWFWKQPHLLFAKRLLG